MNRVNLALLMALVACALLVVSSQHRARKLFIALEQEQERAKALEVEWGQLRLEQSTWAMHGRVERIAAGRLQMRNPPPDRVRAIARAPLPAGALE